MANTAGATPTPKKSSSKKRKRKISEESIDRDANANAKAPRHLSAENPSAAADEEEEKEEKETHAETDVKITDNYCPPQFPWRRTVSWKNLDFILSLQGKELSTQKKIELAIDFVTSVRGNSSCVVDDDDPRFESVAMLHLVPFLNDWIQSLLISVDKKKAPASDRQEFDPCLDSRSWVVFKFCLEESSSLPLSYSPNLLRAVSCVVRHAIVGNTGESLSLFEIVSECFFSLFSSHGQSFNASVDLWVSAADASLNLVCKTFANEHCRGNAGDVLLRISSSVLQPFANYLRAHPSSKNVFPVVVDRLLEQLLAVLVSLNCPVDGSGFDVLKIVDDILSNGLFHPAHIDGFLSIRSSEKYVFNSEKPRTGIKESISHIKSYHKHLFRKLEQLVSEKKLHGLDGLGHLLILFVRRVKRHKGAPRNSLQSKKIEKTEVVSHSEPADTRGRFENSVEKHTSVSEKSLSMVSLDDETCKAVFDIFVQFMEPIVLNIKRYSEIRWSEVGDCSVTFISEAHLTLKSINRLLACFMHEKIYSRMKDTSEGAHFYFLKEVYDRIISFTTQIHVLWQSVFMEEDRSYAEMLLLVAKEVIISMGHFLEIEYKIIGDDLFGLWILMLSFMAIDLSLVETQHIASEILCLGCHLVSVYSELRQVDDAIFALCTAVRFLGFPSSDVGLEHSRLVSCRPYYLPEACVKSLVTLLCSQELRHAVATAVKSIPEGQSSSCIQQLKIDVNKSLEWMKSSSLGATVEKLEKRRVPNSRMLSLSLQAELLGKGLSEIYTIILDSLTVTAGNSILVGNSMKDLMTAIQPSLGCLVQSHPDAYDEFFLAVAGRRHSTRKMREFRSSMSCFFLFFFRVYISCRSLYRQSISLMPPGSSRKASEAMGDLFTAFSGKSWLERTDWLVGDYFSWIVKPSTHLVTIMKSIPDIFLQKRCAGKEPLVFVLHTMAFQRLVDLNRQIKALEFVKERDIRLAQTKLLDDAALHTSYDGSKKLEIDILAFKQEAKDLTNFITGYLPFVQKKHSASLSVKGDVSGARQEMLSVDESDSWDFAVLSINEESLPTAIWWLLCQNTDVWCPHATKKCLKKFLSLLFYYSLSCISDFKIITEQNVGKRNLQRKATPHCISLELLTDAILYEQTFLCRHLTSRFCHILKKTLSSLSHHSFSSDVSFGSIPDWSTVLSKLDQAKVDGINNTHGHIDGLATELDPVPHNLQNKKFLKGVKDFPLAFIDITTCQSLLNLLCWIPKGYESSTTLSIYLTHVLNIESIVVANLLEYESELFLHSHYELLKLFVSCRRALRYLLVVLNDANLEARQSSLVQILFKDSFSVAWLLKSVSGVVGLSPALCDEDHARQVKDMMFALMDHTAHIFSILSESHMKTAVQPLINEEIPSTELHICDGGHEGDSVTEADLCSDSTAKFRFLLDEMRNLLVTMKESDRNTEVEAGARAVNWNKLSSMISCCQGYLWGIASALDSVDKAKAQSQKKRFCHVLKHQYLSIDVFENFVDFCVNMLLVDNRMESESLCGFDSHPELDCMNKSASSYTTLRTVVGTSGGESEISPIDEKETDLMDIKDGCLASASVDKNINGSNIRKTSRSLKRSLLVNGTVNALTDAHKINCFELKHLDKSLLRSLLKGERPEVAFTLRQLFFASSAILRLKYLLSSPRFSKVGIRCCRSISISTVILIGTSHFVLSEFEEMVGRPHPFSFVWLEGTIKYLEVLGYYFPLSDPLLTRNMYAKLIGIHLMAIGKCISLQGKLATLASHETESKTKTLKGQEGSSYNGVLSHCHDQYSVNAFKSRLRMSFKMLIREALELHLLSAIQALERALVGVQEGCHVIYEIQLGNADGGRVSSTVAAGIDCLDLILDFVSGGKRSNIVRRHIQSLVCALFNIVLHLQSPLIFVQGKLNHEKGQAETDPDSGSVVLMCVEVLTKVAGKPSLFQMDPTHVSHALHLPSTLFKHFSQLRALPSRYHSLVFTASGVRLVDRQFSVELFAACCKLLYTVLRHRQSESERCIALLEDSVSTLLYCLEMVDSDLASKNNYLVWEVEEGIKCASFLRRIYEEIRQQKDILGRYCFHFLSNYVWIFSGYGPLKTGIRREIDEALRPGVYALIDACFPDDLQQLHVVLGEGPCRSTLAALQHDYKLNFQYEGKI